MGFLGEMGVTPGLNFQANNDHPAGGIAIEPMKSMVPEGAIIPKDTIPPETMTTFGFLPKEALAQIQKVAAERGTVAAAAEARGLMD